MKNNSGKMLIAYIVKAISVTIVCVLFFSALASELFYKLDISTEYSKLISVIICAFTSIIVTFISISRFKNSGAILGIIAQLPLVFFSLINLIFGSNTLALFIIKLGVSIIIGALIGALRVKRSQAFKV